jgi:hypothetical protein
VSAAGSCVIEGGRIMAIEKKKMQDPTDTALSAIEQALNLDDGPLRDKDRDGAEDTGAAAADPKLPDVEAHDFTNGPFRDLDIDAAPARPERPIPADEPPRPAFVAPDRTAVANDDR